MKKRNAYILTRLYYTETSKESPFMTRFTRTIQSVVKNAKNYKDGQVIWILYDDSPESFYFNDGKDAVLSLIENSGVKRENLHHFRSEKPGRHHRRRGQDSKETDKKNQQESHCEFDNTYWKAKVEK